MTLGDITTFDICKLKNGTFAMVFPNRNDKTYGLSLWQSNATSLYYLCNYDFDFICTANSDTDGYCIEKSKPKSEQPVEEQSEEYEKGTFVSPFIIPEENIR